MGQALTIVGFIGGDGGSLSVCHNFILEHIKCFHTLHNITSQVSVFDCMFDCR